VFARYRNPLNTTILPEQYPQSPSTDGRTTESKVRQECEEKNDAESDIEHGQREHAET